jgi:hypothetical protein
MASSPLTTALKMFGAEAGSFTVKYGKQIVPFGFIGPNMKRSLGLEASLWFKAHYLFTVEFVRLTTSALMFRRAYFRA